MTEDDKDDELLSPDDLVLSGLMDSPRGRGFLAGLIVGYDSCSKTTDSLALARFDGERSLKVNLVERMKMINYEAFCKVLMENDQ